MPRNPTVCPDVPTRDDRTPVHERRGLHQGGTREAHAVRAMS